MNFEGIFLGVRKYCQLSQTLRVWSPQTQSVWGRETSFLMRKSKLEKNATHFSTHRKLKIFKFQMPDWPVSFLFKNLNNKEIVLI